MVCTFGLSVLISVAGGISFYSRSSAEEILSWNSHPGEAHLKDAKFSMGESKRPES